jgi:hypothetical protein
MNVPPTLDDLRRHVLDDASELARTIGMAGPLFRTWLGDPEKHAAESFLRRILARQVVLVVARMHEPACSKGKTGVTASLPGLLTTAVAESVLHAAEKDQYDQEIDALKRDMEREQVPFSELHAFRNAELAHSLHRWTPPISMIVSSPVLEFARGTHDLAMTIDALIAARTGAISRDLRTEPAEWKKIGETFWAAHDID